MDDNSGEAAGVASHVPSRGSCLHHRSQPQKLWMITVVKQLELHHTLQTTDT